MRTLLNDKVLAIELQTKEAEPFYIVQFLLHQKILCVDDAIRGVPSYEHHPKNFMDKAQLAPNQPCWDLNNVNLD
jgi:hypothetical protein